jgi:AcrR family transcriptional regulator
MPRTEEENQRIREERKEQIVDVAAIVFARKGLAGTRIADIAAAGDMSQGLIFRYFASKEEVFAAVVEDALESSIRLAQAALELSCSPLEKLRWLLRIYLVGMWRKPEYGLVILHALSSESLPQEVREHIVAESSRVLQIYRQIIVQGQEAGEIVQEDPAMLTLAFGASLQGLVAGVRYMPDVLGIKEPPDPEVVLRLLKR